MTFNQQLIAKARKGEIAILNDGSVEELREVCQEVLADDFYANGKYNYYMLIDDVWNGFIHCKNEISHSVKDFFMTDQYIINIIEIHNNQPRTYKVTRQQMKEIHDLIDPTKVDTARFRAYVSRHFDLWTNETVLEKEAIGDIIGYFEPDKIPELIRSIFPEYFFIPEGEPVLVRQKGKDWFIRVSDGKGKAYDDAQLSGHSTLWDEIIPFTKNPPK